MSDDAKRPRPSGARRGPPPRRSGPSSRPPQLEALWLFGLHAVRDAITNPRRRLRRLLVTPNARLRLGAALEAAEAAGVPIETQDPRRFAAPLDPASVHQGAALETDPLDWGALETVCAPTAERPAPIAVLLDRVTDPHNVGAILRSAAAFGAVAVIAPRRHAAPESGALAKAASGALERQPYLRVGNLAAAMEALTGLGYQILGLDGEGESDLAEATQRMGDGPVALALGAEGPGLRERTRHLCHAIARAPTEDGFSSLNVSNAAAVALYALKTR